MKQSALVLWVTCVVFSLGAAVWAWTYPLTEVLVTPSHGAESIPGTEGAGFSAFVRFVFATTVLGLGTALWVFRSQRRGVWPMLWTTLVVALATWWFLFFGSYLVDVFHPLVEGKPAPGTVVEVATLVRPSVGLLAAPTIALCCYWISANVMMAGHPGDAD
ncbi:MULTISPECIES: hypothetical protein [unclassified Corynebacterium]|nr:MULTISPECIES: hypothetical protein [unclassified Corynebacterium]